MTGLAALVGGVSDRAHTHWGLDVVVALARFSVLTQLTFLLVLENYFKNPGLWLSSYYLQVHLLGNEGRPRIAISNENAAHAR